MQDPYPWAHNQLRHGAGGESGSREPSRALFKPNSSRWGEGGRSLRRLLNFIFVYYENESPKKGVIVSKLVFLFQHRYSTLEKASGPGWAGNSPCQGAPP